MQAGSRAWTIGYEIHRSQARTFARIARRIAVVLSTATALSLPAAAQQPGPMKPPDANAPPDSSTTVTPASPSLPIDQLIQRFAASEAEFKRERDNYTYTQTFVMQTIDPSGK